MYIYFILNKINGKYYIGQTTRTVERRWKDHLIKAEYKNKAYSRNSHLYNAIRYYGSKNFEVRTLLFCDTLEILNKAEEYFILYFNSTNPDLGYNKTFGGDSELKSEETKRKIGNSHRGIKRTSEQKKRMSQARTGILVGPFSEKHRFNLRLAAEKRRPKAKEGYKICTKCRSELPMDKNNFHFSSRGVDGFSLICKTCRNLLSRECFSRKIKRKI